ncbi:hypothetical protein V6N12_044139 [Hibiscus sabdariffa]|uniref:hAT-like transposase RNase-H fold domain-containing protein n=1 Tax=Hibiscus sabdariffa TaxID=183260 RepID=A0ABR2DGD3_9ROSI
MGSQMRENFDKYYGELDKTNAMMLVAMVLDPRYKLRFVKFSLRKLFPLEFTKVDAMCDHLYDVLQKLYGFYNARIFSSSKNSTHDSKLHKMDVDGSENAMPSQNENLNKLYNEFNEEDVEDKCKFSKHKRCHIQGKEGRFLQKEGVSQSPEGVAPGAVILRMQPIQEITYMLLAYPQELLLVISRSISAMKERLWSAI